MVIIKSFFEKLARLKPKFCEALKILTKCSCSQQTIINLHEKSCGGIKFAHNFTNKRLSLKFSLGILQILLDQYNVTYVVSGILFWKKLYCIEICKNRNGELGNGMKGIWRMGMEMQEIGVGIRGIWAEMRECNGIWKKQNQSLQNQILFLLKF